MHSNAGFARVGGIIEQVLDAEVHGYVLQNTDKVEIVTGILMEAAGKQFLCN
jgi:hypothetical protein